MHRALLALLAACNASPPAPAPSRNIAAPEPPSSELARLPGAIWFTSDGALHRIAKGVRRELARDVRPTDEWLGDALIAIRADGGAVAVAPDGTMTPVRPASTPPTEDAAHGSGDVRRAAALPNGPGDEPLAPTGAKRRVSRSPDGSAVAYVETRPGGSRIVLVDTDGSHLRRLTERSESGRDETQPVWSPDGRLIAYVVERGVRTHVWLRDVVTGREQDLTPEGIFDTEPSFSPDGHWVAVSRTRGHDVDLWALPAVGEPVRITTGRQADRSPRWR